MGINIKKFKLTKRGFYEYISYIEKKKTNKIAAIYKDKKISYKQLNIAVDKFCEKIVTDEQVVAIYLPNSIQYIVSFFSILKLNKTVMPVSVNLKINELLKYLRLGNVSFLITNNENYLKIKENTNFSNITLLNIDIGECKKGNRIYKISNNLQDVALLLPTSGSTGNSKIVMLTHENLFANIQANIKALSITEKETTYILLPMCYSYCNTAQFLSHIFVGGTIVIQSNIMHMPTIMRNLNHYSVTNIFINPTVLNLFVEYMDLYPEGVPELHSIYIGTAPVSDVQIKRLISHLANVKCYITYGLTEASPRVTTYLVDRDRIKSSIGKPLQGIELKIVDDNNEDVKIGQIGQIIIKGPNIMKGYYNNITETEHIIVNDWLYTGDCAFFEEDGNIILKGRKKNIIKCSGNIVYPEEIEEVLVMHEAVVDAYVYGLPHIIYGEIVVADIILNENNNLDQLLESIGKHCLKYLTNFKIPQLNIVNHIKKTNTNKNKRIKYNE